MYLWFLITTSLSPATDLLSLQSFNSLRGQLESRLWIQRKCVSALTAFNILLGTLISLDSHFLKVCSSSSGDPDPRAVTVPNHKCHQKRVTEVIKTSTGLHSYCVFLSGEENKNVIHTVGPIARGNLGQSQRDDLEACYKTSLKLMKDNNLRSVAGSGYNEAGQRPALVREDVESDHTLFQLLALSPPSGAHELWICFNPLWPQPEGPCKRPTNQLLRPDRQRLRGVINSVFEIKIQRIRSHLFHVTPVRTLPLLYSVHHCERANDLSRSPGGPLEQRVTASWSEDISRANHTPESQSREYWGLRLR
ncbi:O-acetyl-ADP-ribose deacetylase MACROD2 [Triplophysa tibetana]|uniref:O-acetyl-ADP-ribose deacetylase MACROD2 n=1 Tax=Triplophysa tibetana TaxID=1572043 RepID=A0A5A9PAT4_9TELE|nr:O-acetyl-ADP-ribose deacetylase MACROD2 [Triplophysa tibetana]